MRVSISDLHPKDSSHCVRLGRLISPFILRTVQVAIEWRTFRRGRVGTDERRGVALFFHDCLHSSSRRRYSIARQTLSTKYSTRLLHSLWPSLARRLYLSAAAIPSRHKVDRASICQSRTGQHSPRYGAHYSRRPPPPFSVLEPPMVTLIGLPRWVDVRGLLALDCALRPLLRQHLHSVTVSRLMAFLIPAALEKCHRKNLWLLISIYPSGYEGLT